METFILGAIIIILIFCSWAAEKEANAEAFEGAAATIFVYILIHLGSGWSVFT